MGVRAVEWSAIIIARNEDSVIGRCIESVLGALAGRSAEIILVDSASTDRTVEVAATYPVRIVRIAPTVPLRPAIGRHVGYQHVRGDLLLFMDGDSILDERWIPQAVAALEADPLLAGVSGARERVEVLGQSEVTTAADEYAGCGAELEHLGGPALYRRSALERVGGFNPFMYACEEAELGARLTRAGYHLRRLDARMTQHVRREQTESVAELWRRARRRYPVGMGQLARFALTHRVSASNAVPTVRRHLQFVGLLALGAVAAATAAITGHGWPLGVWLGGMALGFLAFALRARSLAKPRYYFLEWALTGPMVLWGMLLPPVPPDRFDRMPLVYAEDPLTLEASAARDNFVTRSARM